MRTEYTKAAIKQMRTLDNALRERVIIGVEKLPSGDIKKLQGQANSFRLRVGGYRVIFKLIQDTITVTAVLPRGSAYKSL